MILSWWMAARAMRPSVASGRCLAFAASAPDVDEAPSNGGWQALRRRRPRLPQIGAWLIVALAIVVLGVSASVLLRHRLFACSATVEQIERPGLKVEVDGLTTYQPVAEGYMLYEGSVLVAEPGTVAHISLCDESLLRIESAGRWRLIELRRSRNGQLSRVVLEQIVGQASVVSSPAHRGRRAQTIVHLPEGRVELRGVATLRTTDSGETEVEVLQGRCVVLNGAKRRELVAGEALVLP
jgi:hypothetical protein